MTALGAGCGKLQSINLWGCVQVTNAGVIAFGAGCGQLRRINVAGCNKVTDACLMSLVIRNQFMKCCSGNLIIAVNVGMT